MTSRSDEAGRDQNPASGSIRASDGGPASDPDSADIRGAGYAADPDPLILLNDRQRIQQKRSAAIEEAAVVVDEMGSGDAAIPRKRGSLDGSGIRREPDSVDESGMELEPDSVDESVMPRRNRLKMIAAAGGAALAVAAVAIVAMLSFGSSATALTQAAIVEITVKEVVNQVEVAQLKDDATAAANFLPVTVGQALSPGDGLKTFDSSEARVDISVGDFVRVTRTKPNTVWRLGQFSVDDETIIELDQGTIFLFDDSDGPSPKPLKVITPAGTASPKGTWMSLSYDPVLQVAELQCFRGTCLLENDLGSEVLVDEQKTTITRQSPPRRPVVMSKTETRLFVQLPEAVSGEVAIPAPKPPSLPTREPTETPLTPTLAVPAPVGVPVPAADGPVFPHLFVGTAKLNGLPAPDGTVVTAWVDGLSEPLAESVISSSEFAILVHQYGTGPLEGETVVFKLDGAVADNSGTWTSGGSDVLDLDAGSG
jgi:hypothetical protein